jgi:formylglycine-generating enzyme required for sulfatase activity
VGPVQVRVGSGRSPDELRRLYLDELAREANALPWNALSESFANPDNIPPGVADIYTDLDTNELEQVEHEEGLRQFLAHSEQMRRIPAQEMADRHTRLLILGDPGSGKSTFVKHLAYSLANAARSQAPAAALQPIAPWSHGPLLPVYVELRSVAAFAAREGMTRGDVRLFTRYLEQLFTSWGIAAAWPVVQDALAHDETGALLLLDGLDEAPTPQRLLLVEMVQTLSNDPAYKRHRLIVTSRPYAYYDLGQAARLKGFKEVTLAPFNEAQIERFVENWYRRLADPQTKTLAPAEAEQRRNELRRALQRRDHRGLARRPILLTMMVQLHSFTGRLPDDRITLYQAVVDLLLKRWTTRHQEQPTLLEFIGQPGLRDDHLEAALYEVAYKAHAQAQAVEPAEESAGGDESSADISEDDLRRWLRRHLNNSGDNAERFVRYIRERAGLLIRHKSEAYRFPHRTLQEFLAAAHLVTSEEIDYGVQAAELVSREPNRWREVFALAAGFAARQKRPGDAVAAIANLCPQDCDGRGEPSPYQLAQIAADALLEIGALSAQRSPLGQAQWARTQGWLVGALGQNASLSPGERTQAGVRLARLGDPRPGVLDPLQMEFCFVPAGPFCLGSPQDDKLAFENERPYDDHFALPYDYWISRYPLTNGHFAAFMQAGGYQNPAYWREAIDHGLWQEGQLNLYTYRQDEKGEWGYQPGWVARPFDYGEPFHLPNHPQVGVSWYEALAFTRWLTTQLPSGWQAILPNEPEWEKAARGGLHIPTAAHLVPLSALAPPTLKFRADRNQNPARRYPWGNQIERNYVNYHGTEIGATGAVGCFGEGRSPYGVEELSGNVWEWTRSLWGKGVDKAEFAYPYQSADGREQLAAELRIARVVRGGSFGSSYRGVRCAVRFRNNPHGRNNSLGVRVVVLPPSTSGL